MTVLIDSGFLVALHSGTDPHHRRAKLLAQEIMAGRYGQPVISDYLVAELLNYASRKFRFADQIVRMVDEVLGRGREPWLDIAWIDRELFERTVDLYGLLGLERGLSFTDCSSVALARAASISHFASFDGGFDGILARLC
jgi:predicted nucleic acid-binding protein